MGQEWTIALPVLQNASAEKIWVKDARVDVVPEGLDVVGYGAYDLDDTNGLALLSRPGSPGMPDFGKLKNHRGEKVGIGPKEESDIYYVVKVRITGKITENLTGAIFTYESDGRTYEQSLPFEAALRLEGTTPGP
ncbi:hypothetical protein [Streptomyces hydrogenans]|uniref:hypothetical protein n=1 Tax=Streptomyces hydrogenans TaxID=1873719 RepID=UPI003406DBF9